jgi:hypothetical protein
LPLLDAGPGDGVTSHRWYPADYPASSALKVSSQLDLIQGRAISP